MTEKVKELLKELYVLKMWTLTNHQCLYDLNGCITSQKLKLLLEKIEEIDLEEADVV